MQRSGSKANGARYALIVTVTAVCMVAMTGCFGGQKTGGYPGCDDVPAGTKDARSEWQALNSRGTMDNVGGAITGIFTRGDGITIGFADARERAHHEVKLQSERPTLPPVAARELSARFAEFVATIANQPHFADSPSRLALFIEEFSGPQNMEPATLTQIRNQLTHALGRDSAVAENFLVLAYTLDEARTRLVATASEPITDPLVRDAPQDVRQIPWSHVIIASGDWNQTVSPWFDPAAQVPTLTISANVNFNDVQSRSTVASEMFMMEFVYHPRLGWISRETDQTLQAWRDDAQAAPPGRPMPDESAELDRMIASALSRDIVEVFVEGDQAAHAGAPRGIDLTVVGVRRQGGSNLLKTLDHEVTRQVCTVAQDRPSPIECRAQRADAVAPLAGLESVKLEIEYTVTDRPGRGNDGSRVVRLDVWRAQDQLRPWFQSEGAFEWNARDARWRERSWERDR